MKIVIPSFRQGSLLLSLEAEVEGEASGHMLALATESAKTSVMSVLDGAIAKTLAKGVEYKRADATKAQIKAAKLPAIKGITDVKLAVVGDYEKKSGPTAAVVGASMMTALRAAKVDEAAIQAACLAASVAYSLPAPTVEPVKTTDGVELSEG